MANDTIYNGFVKVDYPEPHIGRAKQILAKHPEVRQLFGNTPSTFLHILFLVSTQIVLAIVLRDQPIWMIAAVAWLVGALFNHALFVMIHEATHNLVFKGTLANRWAGIVSNFPIIFPAAMGFRTFHLLHHRYQGEFDRDADLAGPKEAKLIGKTAPMKALWLLFFFFFEGVVRPARLKDVRVFDKWAFINSAVEISFIAALCYAFGLNTLIYLGFSTLFCVGLHPVGARWIQEHYVIVPNQETYSYYGALNYTCYNVGYHNEHHDLMMVPWSRLPKLKKMAPEFYDSLYSHKSWTLLLLKFLFSPQLSLYSRVVRPSREQRNQTNAAATALANAQSAADVVTGNPIPA